VWQGLQTHQMFSSKKVREILFFSESDFYP
jgi:hypothetical protein